MLLLSLYLPIIILLLFFKHKRNIPFPFPNLVRTDHPENTKKGGVCIHYKESLPVRVINLPYFKEVLLLEISFNKKFDSICNLSFPKSK